MKETDRILGELRRAFRGKAWHGPAVFEILDGVDAKRAADHPISDAHSIRELVRHVSTWIWVPNRRIREGIAIESPEAVNFPPVNTTTEEAWREAQDELARSVEELEETIQGLSTERLEETVAGKSYPIATMLHGVVQHALYHAGQMALLKKA